MAAPMTAKTTVRYRPDDSPWEGRGWEHHCNRRGCTNVLTAWTWHLSWWGAMGMAWAHLRDDHGA